MNLLNVSNSTTTVQQQVGSYCNVSDHPKGYPLSTVVSFELFWFVLYSHLENYDWKLNKNKNVWHLSRWFLFGAELDTEHFLTLSSNN